MHVATCVDFAVNLQTGTSTCIKDDRNITDDEIMDKEQFSHAMKTDDAMISEKGTLNRNGYK